MIISGFLGQSGVRSKCGRKEVEISTFQEIFIQRRENTTFQNGFFLPFFLFKIRERLSLVY